MNIKVIQLITKDYIVCDLEELDEEPSVYMKNPFLVENLTEFEYSRDKRKRKHVQRPHTVLIDTVEYQETMLDDDGNEVEEISTEYEYAYLKPYPEFTNDRDILFNSDRIMTIFEPKPEIAKLYMELIAE